MSEEIENKKLFNQVQEDTRRRADTLARAVFIIAGGALTVSIGIFARSDRPSMTDFHLVILQLSWWCLFGTILVLTLALFVMLVRDYPLGERWRKQLHGENTDASGQPGWADVILWTLGGLGMLLFIGGMLGLAYTATAAISP
jgi:hypothetical protein